MSDALLPVLPALRWSGADGYALSAPSVGRWLDEGAAGFILFGGTAEAARGASEWLRERAGRPLLLGADLERGVGQQFRGATALPPLAALAAGGQRDRLFQAGELTGREALAVGVPWVFAPVADLALEPRNPIVGTRSPGAEPETVADAVVAWTEGCLSAGAVPCVKHFPGHGRTLEDSHRTLPTVEVDRDTLSATDLLPFRAAIAAGVPSVMTAHVAYPSLDPSGRPATRSRPILTDLLRGSLGFDGVVVTDALIMEGVGDGAAPIVEALRAGVDLLLYPPADLPVREVLDAVDAAGRLDPEERAHSLERVRRLVSRIAEDPGREERGWGAEGDRESALRWALESIGGAGGELPRPEAVSLTVVDDDVGGPYPAPARDVFAAVLQEAGVGVTEVPAVTESGPEAGSKGGSGAARESSCQGGGSLPILCVYAEPRAWKGRAGLSRTSRAQVRAWQERHRSRGGVIAFGGPTLWAELPADRPTLLAWGGEALMQAAAARRLAR